MAHTSLPADLPKPAPDSACDHLPSTPIPATLALPTTASTPTNLSSLPGLTLLVLYPRTGAPQEIVPAEWNAIPGARGCTPQLLSFQRALPALKDQGVRAVFGVSAQDSEYQAEAKGRLGLDFELLSDEAGAFRDAMRVPVFEWEGKWCMKRVTMAVEGGRVLKAWYPVFPPDGNAEEVLVWLKERNAGVVDGEQMDR